MFDWLKKHIDLFKNTLRRERVTINYTNIPPEAQAAFDDAFAQMDKAFEAMDKAFTAARERK